jgi:hypothetical protein
VLKVAVVAAAAELLCLAGESADGLMLFNGYDRESLTAICKLKDSASRARSSAVAKAASVIDLSDFKRFVKAQCATGLSNTNDKPRCDAAARKAIGNGLWARLFLLAAAMDSSGVVKELHFKGEAAFVAEAGDKARVWWNQSGNSEAAKMKSAWLEAAKKHAAAGGVPPESPRRSACLLPLPLCKPLALAVVLMTALSRTSEAPCERDLTERRKRIL